MDAETPPDGLKGSGTLLWEAVTAEHVLDAHELLLLVQACRCADRLDMLTEDASSSSLTVENSRGDLVTHPSIVEARQQSVLLSRLLASLRLPSGEDDGRPQRRGAARGSYGTLKAVMVE